MTKTINDLKSVLLTLLTSSLLLGMVFLISCDNGGDDEDPKPVKYSRWVVSGIIIVVLVLSVVFAFDVNSALEDVQDTINESYTPYGDFISDATKIQGTLNEGVTQCDDILGDDGTGDDTIDDSVESIQSTLETSVSFMDAFLVDADGISWEDSGDDLDPVREAILYVCLGVTVFLLIIVIVVKYFAVAHNRNNLSLLIGIHPFFFSCFFLSCRVFFLLS